MKLADKESFRDAMARVGAAVNIITTDGPAGRAGFTASAVCSVTDTPPTLLVCLNRSASVWPVFSEHHTLCVNTLAAGQEALSTLFGGKTAMDERFAAADAHHKAAAGLVEFGLLAVDFFIRRFAAKHGKHAFHAVFSQARF